MNAIEADFLDHDFGRTFDLVTCSQVLEHQAAARFSPEEGVDSTGSPASPLGTAALILLTYPTQETPTKLPAAGTLPPICHLCHATESEDCND